MSAKLVPFITAIVVIVLQIVIAPLLSFSSVVPNFLIAFVLVLSIVRRADSAYGYAFVLGLISDLLSQTPVGLTSLLLLIASFVLSRTFEVLDRSSIAMPLLACLVSVFVIEVLTSVVLLVLGYPATFLDLLIYRIFPVSFCNVILCVILFFVSRKFVLETPANDVWKISNKNRFR